MKSSHIVLLLVVVATVISGCANNSKIGSTAYDQMQFDKSNYYLKKVVEAKKEDAKTLRQLAEGYRLTNQSKKAELTYAKLIHGKFKGGTTADDYLNYGKMLMMNEKYDDARNAFRAYDSLNDFKSQLAKVMMKSCDSVSMFHQDTTLFEINETIIRGVGERFGASPLDNGIVICSETESVDNTANKKKELWGKSAGNLDLFFTSKDTSSVGEYIKPLRLKGKINTPVHEGPCTFSADGKMCYFTRTALVQSTNKNDVKVENVLKIYSAERDEDGNWVNTLPLNFNSDDYSVMHPTLNVDGDKLIFASDRNGGFGGSDLYISYKSENGDWTEPKNLGAEVNSSGNEVFPFLTKDNTLYFSSDGFYTLGGLDVFVSSWDGSVKFSPAENLNIPLNTSHDDYCFTVDPNDEATGWVSSNRSTKERIYEWKSHNPKLFFEGIITERTSQKPIAGARVQVTNKTDGTIYNAVTDEYGYYRVDGIKGGNDYLIRAGKAAYRGLKETYAVKVEKKRMGITKNYVLSSVENNGVLRIRNIYFSFGSFLIKKESAQVLDTLVKKLKDQPNIDIELSAHTDCKGSAKYNKWLSERRAQAAVNYMVKHGILKSRMVGKGYGESKPINRCKDGVKCSDEEYEKNRRIEFKMIKLRTDQQKAADAAKSEAAKNNAGKVIITNPKQ
ncbi:MAG: hypothetical protein RIQ33_1334 [Bacteroidota bacterium]|jgi:outer membrane protein OmpA-like peptidoglycan-associated protein/outer membrane murein-binding lipoprotein Lpp